MLSFKELIAVDYTGTGDVQLAKNAKRRKDVEDVLEDSSEVEEGKNDYDIYHKSYSSAVQHAIEQVKKRGYEIDMDDYHNKVAVGPRKPSVGKTNSFSIDLTKSGKPVKNKLHMQVYGMEGGKYELNMYTEGLEEDFEFSEELLSEEDVNLFVVDEAILTPADRARKKQILRRSKSRIAIGRLIASRRMASKSVVQRRAKRRARAMVFKKILKGRAKSSLSYATRGSVERLVNKRKNMTDRLTKRLIPKVRKDAVMRLSGLNK
tara:strand:+ start:1141 stop:1929 length:789 start_codon:yes stop_codon:yes gene_type:complete